MRDHSGFPLCLLPEVQGLSPADLDYQTESQSGMAAVWACFFWSLDRGREQKILSCYDRFPLCTRQQSRLRCLCTHAVHCLMRMHPTSKACRIKKIACVDILALVVTITWDLVMPIVVLWVGLRDVCIAALTPWEQLAMDTYDWLSASGLLSGNFFQASIKERLSFTLSSSIAFSPGKFPVTRCMDSSAVNVEKWTGTRSLTMSILISAATNKDEGTQLLCVPILLTPETPHRI